MAYRQTDVFYHVIVARALIYVLSNLVYGFYWKV